jgi:hypothetical protein
VTLVSSCRLGLLWYWSQAVTLAYCGIDHKLSPWLTVVLITSCHLGKLWRYHKLSPGKALRVGTQRQTVVDKWCGSETRTKYRCRQRNDVDEAATVGKAVIVKKIIKLDKPVCSSGHCSYSWKTCVGRHSLTVDTAVRRGNNNTGMCICTYTQHKWVTNALESRTNYSLTHKHVQYEYLLRMWIFYSSNATFRIHANSHYTV